MPVLPPRPRRAPKLRKHPRSGYYYAVFYDPARRPKQKWFALQTNVKRRAEKLFHQADEAWFAGTFDPWRDRLTEAGVTLTDAVERYCVAQVKAGTWRPKTERWRRDTLGRFVASLPAGLGPAHVRPADVAAFVDDRPMENARHVQDPTGSKRTASTRRTYHSALRAFFAWCVENQYCDVNPADDVARASPDRRAIAHLRPEQFQALLKTIRDDYDLKMAAGKLHGPHEQQIVWLIPVLELGVTTGLRPGELHRLRWTDVDLDGRTLYVRNTERGRTKTGKERQVPLVRPAVEVLQRLAAERPSEDPADPVLLSPDRSKGLRPFSIQVASRLFRDYAATADLPPEVTLKSLRATFGTWLASADVDVQHVQQALGHASIRTTTEHYADVWKESTRSTLDRAFSRLFASGD